MRMFIIYVYQDRTGYNRFQKSDELVGGFNHLENISQWEGLYIPYIMENKNMFETTNLPANSILLRTVSICGFFHTALRWLSFGRAPGALRFLTGLVGGLLFRVWSRFADVLRVCLGGVDEGLFGLCLKFTGVCLGFRGWSLLWVCLRLKVSWALLGGVFAQWMCIWMYIIPSDQSWSDLDSGLRRR